MKKNFVVCVVAFDTEKRTTFRLKFVLEDKWQSCPQPKTFGSITIFRVCGALEFEKFPSPNFVKNQTQHTKVKIYNVFVTVVLF